jgi:hypothetical protein
MKIKNYPGFCNLLIKDLKEKFKIDRKFFPFNDPDRLDLVAEEFPTIEAAKLWINKHIKND